MYGRVPNHVLDLLPLPTLKGKASDDAEALAENIQEVQHQVREKWKESHAKYEAAAHF